jgi:hypothetical protein
MRPVSNLYHIKHYTRPEIYFKKLKFSSCVTTYGHIREVAVIAEDILPLGGSREVPILLSALQPQILLTEIISVAPLSLLVCI